MNDPSDAPSDLRARLIGLLGRDPDRRWSLSELAHALEPDRWEAAIGTTRAAVKALARAGQIVLYRKGKPADPDEVRGVYRIGLARHD